VQVPGVEITFQWPRARLGLGFGWLLSVGDSSNSNIILVLDVHVAVAFDHVAAVTYASTQSRRKPGAADHSAELSLLL